MGHGFLRLRRWDFLEHGLDGLDTDFYAFGDGDFRNKDLKDWTRIFRLRRWDFLEQGLDGWDTDFSPSAVGILGTRIGWIGHGFYAFGDGDFRNKDWTDGTRIFTPSAMGIFGNTDWMDRTRINKTEFL